MDVSFDSPVMSFVCSIYRRQELTKKPCEGAFKITLQNNSDKFSSGPLTCLAMGSQFSKGGRYRMHHLDPNLTPIRNWYLCSHYTTGHILPGQSLLGKTDDYSTAFVICT